MKITKISQEIIDQNSMHNYLSIGHEEDWREEREPIVLWVFYEGKILKKNVNDLFDLDGDNGHSAWAATLPEEMDTSWGKYYTGRYDPNTGNLSLVIPKNYTNRRIPNILIKALNRNFNPQRIYTF